MTRDELVEDLARIIAYDYAWDGEAARTHIRAVLERLRTLGAGHVTAVLWPLTWGRSQFCRTGLHDRCNTLTDSQTAPCECDCHAPRPPSLTERQAAS